MRNLKKFMTEKSSRIHSLHTMAELATMLEVQNDTYRDARLNGLKADLSFLDGDHGVFQADIGVLHLHFLLHLGGLVLGGAHGFEGVAQLTRKTGAAGG